MWGWPQAVAHPARAGPPQKSHARGSPHALNCTNYRFAPPKPALPSDRALQAPALPAPTPAAQRPAPLRRVAAPARGAHALTGSAACAALSSEKRPAASAPARAPPPCLECLLCGWRMPATMRTCATGVRIARRTACQRSELRQGRLRHGRQRARRPEGAAVRHRSSEAPHCAEHRRTNPQPDLISNLPYSTLPCPTAALHRQPASSFLARRASLAS